jgi:hypothetical protein
VARETRSVQAIQRAMSPWSRKRGQGKEGLLLFLLGRIAWPE